MAELDKIDFKYCTGYTYDIKRNCRESGCDDGVCYCSTIHNVCVISAKVNEIVNLIYNVYFDLSKSGKRNTSINLVLFGISKEIDIYTIDRILRFNKIWKNETWDVKIRSGYYGEEINEIVFNTSVAKKIEKELDVAFAAEGLNKRIEYLLQLEYGYILPELQNCQYELRKINKSDIIFGNLEHYKKLEKLDYYINFNGIKGIAIEKDGKYRLIDGYHRVYSTNDKEITILNVIPIKSI